MAGLDQRSKLSFLDEEEKERLEKEREEAQGNAGLGFRRAREKLAQLGEGGADKRTIAAAGRRLRMKEERSQRVSARETERLAGDFTRTRDVLRREAVGQQAPENVDVELLTQLYDRVQGFVVQNQPREAYSAALDLLTAAKQLDRQAAMTAVDSQGNPRPVEGVGPNEKAVIGFLFDKDSPGKLPDYLKRIDAEATGVTSLSTASPQATALPGQNQVTTAGGRTLSLDQAGQGQFAQAASGPALGAPAPAPAIPNAPSIAPAPVEQPFVGPPNPGAFQPPIIKGLSALLEVLGGATAGATSPGAISSALPPLPTMDSLRAAAPPTQGLQGVQESRALASLSPPPPAPAGDPANAALRQRVEQLKVAGWGDEARQELLRRGINPAQFGL